VNVSYYSDSDSAKSKSPTLRPPRNARGRRGRLPAGYARVPPTARATHSVGTRAWSSVPAASKIAPLCALRSRRFLWKLAALKRVEGPIHTSLGQRPSYGAISVEDRRAEGPPHDRLWSGPTALLDWQLVHPFPGVLPQAGMVRAFGALLTANRAYLSFLLQ
jgi:hypothetical protein